MNDGNGLLTKTVYEHYIDPQAKKYKQEIVNVRDIKWMSSNKDTVSICIYGDIKKKTSPETGYITISNYPGMGSSVPELNLQNSGKIFLASFNKDLLYKTRPYTFPQTIRIKSSTISPNCKTPLYQRIMPTFTGYDNGYDYFQNLQQDDDFVFKHTLNRNGIKRVARSYYVIVNNQDNNKNILKFRFIIDTHVEHYRYDKMKGYVFYSLALVVDIVTSPLQYILLRLRWG